MFRNFLFAILILGFLYAQEAPVYLRTEKPQVDQKLDSLDWKTQLGQLFMVAVYPQKGEAHIQSIEALIKNYGIGGIIFMQGDPESQVKIYNRLQKISKIPLLTSIDGEWGLQMRLKKTLMYPKQMTLGAIQNPDFIEAMGAQIAEQCRRTGVHINFAPVVDINNNPNNPIINYRSFGDQREAVAERGIAYMKGLESNGVLACAKHFPGHGDTDADSHLSLPVIKHDRARLDSVELYPFRKLIEAGVGSMMVAHLSIPALGTKGNEASTLTPAIAKTLLQEEYQYKGLVFTDALNMKGVSQYYQPGEVDAKALEAGNDVLLFSEDVGEAFKQIEQKIQAGAIELAQIKNSCRKILYLKSWLDLENQRAVTLDNLSQDLHQERYKALIHQLYEQAITLVKNDQEIIPVAAQDFKNIAVIHLGLNSKDDFAGHIDSYQKSTHFFLSKWAKPEQIQAMKAQLKDFDLLIVNIANTSSFPSKKYGLYDGFNKVVEGLGAIPIKKILCYPGNPYGYKYLGNTEMYNAIVIAYEDRTETRKIVPQIIFGGLPALGKLPVSIGPFKSGSGLISSKIRLSFGYPAQEGMDSYRWQLIDSIVADALQYKATPGAQLLVAKNGRVIYQKAYGYQTMADLYPIDNQSIYDVASITKVAATTMGLMALESQGKFNIEGQLSDYLAYVDSTPYANIKLKEMLCHQAGLKPWIPFYMNTLDSLKQPDCQIYANTLTQQYQVEVARKMYMDTSYRDSIYKWILNTPLMSKKRYKYSDVGYYFLKDIVEQQTHQNYVQFTDSLYRLLGVEQIGYLPQRWTSLAQIAPTELDYYFRMQKVQGYVHDQGAAMLGGVGGHAGIFANSWSLAQIFQMFLNQGSYAGVDMIRPDILKKYTSKVYDDNRRAIGFDKPTGEDAGSTCEDAPLSSYGHTGFTGTIAWADPENQMVYIFLSNRTYPSSENKVLLRRNTRTNIQAQLYAIIREQKGIKELTVSR